MWGVPMLLKRDVQRNGSNEGSGLALCVEQMTFYEISFVKCFFLAG